MDKRKKEESIIDSWCIKNNILIYAEPIQGKKLLRIAGSIRGRPIRGKELYKQYGKTKKGDLCWARKVRELRKYYYEQGTKKK